MMMRVQLDGERDRGPVRVVFADLDGPLPDLSPYRDAAGTPGSPAERGYTSALVFATRRGVPVGHLEVDLRGGVVPAAELARRLAALAPPPDATGAVAVPDSDLPFISVVVPTVMARVELLERSVDRLLRLNYPAFEVVLVDNRPDGSAERAALHDRLSTDARVVVVAESRPGISAARNRGVRHARGDIVAFTDDDAEVDPNWLRAIGRRFAAESDVDAVTGPVLPAELDTPAQVWFEFSGGKLESGYSTVHYRRAAARGWSRARFSVVADDAADPAPRAPLPVYRAKFGMGVNMAFRTAALAAIGGFDEALGTGTPTRGGEDVVALSRLLYSGHRLAFDPAAVIRHHHRRTLDELDEQMYGYGVGYTAALTALVRSDPRHLIGLLHLVPPAVKLMRNRSTDRTVSSYPPRLRRSELRGLAAGPVAYLRSRLTRPPRPISEPAPRPRVAAGAP